MCFKLIGISPTYIKRRRRSYVIGRMSKAVRLRLWVRTNLILLSGSLIESFLFAFDLSSQRTRAYKRSHVKTEAKLLT